MDKSRPCSLSPRVVSVLSIACYSSEHCQKRGVFGNGGFNIYPAELERVIAAHPAVSLVAVGPQTDRLKGEIGKADIVLKTGVHVTEDDLVAFCREHLAAYY